MTQQPIQDLPGIHWPGFERLDFSVYPGECTLPAGETKAIEPEQTVIVLSGAVRLLPRGEVIPDTGVPYAIGALESL